MCVMIFSPMHAYTHSSLSVHGMYVCMYVEHDDDDGLFGGAAEPFLLLDDTLEEGKDIDLR